ncbi:hypothetical protein DICPUDRAFT_50939 [Dictyostelium purpureum]|uniref:Transmembrane protein 144 n=1 Tax=Dictyostelium purpureum TaxID=5786 RepID=F1A146_DICPU|nr:uncharacterized protein DICPUDRAFT_50939 [Dictyostelium purpureum]EGC30078.1 hypothetical protein DICPUDRAFT_50939 [Dictyostelium purpureum]|eukprot:XP_003293389.1 hypothetical protein DICPUDRAFT_50939 [Dictyostelium purpureum]
MVNAQVLGYIGAAVASVFFGSNYVPVKNFPTGNGIAFAWVMSVGIISVAYVAMFIAGSDGKNLYLFDPWGLLGGTLWSLGNFCVIPIVKTIGLGLGLLLWCCCSIVAGFFTGKFGLFGLEKQVVSHPAMNWIGFGCIVAAIVFFFFIKPTLENEDTESNSYSSIVDDYPIINEAGYRGSIQSSKLTEKSFFERIPQPMKTMLGIGLAIFSGIMYGVNMVPMQLWKQSDPSANPLSFIFCHFSGIFIFNTIVFFVYAIIKRPPQVFPQTMLPSFFSGVLWGIANCGLMVATQNLGYTVGFPMGASGPMVVSSIWSVVYFKEIQGVKNLLILLISFLFLGAGITTLALSG